MQLDQKITLSETSTFLNRTAKKIAPLWSLENFVAVNPYLGMTHMEFSEAMDFLHKSSQVRATLPVSFFLKALKEGEMSRVHIADALEHNSYGLDIDTDSFIARLIENEEPNDAVFIRTMSDLASEINGKKWERFLIDRISFWASAYFDNSQAIWDTSDKNTSLFAAWKKEAEVDLTPEAMGLKGFRNFIKTLPDDYREAASIALALLGLSEESIDYYLIALTMKMNGWAGFAARIDWDEGLAERSSHAVEEFIAILLVWELALKELLPYENLEAQWKKTRKRNQELLADETMSKRLAQQLVLQDAFDRANQRSIIEKINGQEHNVQDEVKPKAQAIFCIDVRSELFRRNLEAADAEIETMGFAGFFAFPIKYVPIGHNEGANQCPVLLNTSHTIKESLGNEEDDQRMIGKRSLKEHVFKAWKSFKSGAISCFGFVSPLGLYFLPKLLSDAFGITRPLPRPEENGLSGRQLAQKGIQLDGDASMKEMSGIPLEERIQMAASALKAMSLTENFANTVLIVGHGASTVNNPHATGLDCGACGGHSGEANAKVAAAVLNETEVRRGLKDAGIHIPETTYFIAALHDTTTDEVNLFNSGKAWPATHEKEIDEIKYALKLAGENARKERGARMKIEKGDVGRQVLQRSKDWSQVRPEWGLAGCSSFIVAPRKRTAQLNFGGKAFMHSYDWKKDEGFGVLELIMTAPMVVTSWINLQYYASAVDNKKFGSGNKTLHNVVGGAGVLEGFGGDLRVGLPWQSVHDGEQFQHQPQRLNVIIEAPVDEMSKILEKHESIRHLCDNQWIYLFGMNEQGKVAYKYIGDLQWEVVH
ncbi:YbcC family protein [Lentiprolixibacter aurantiacus]|uniref:Probable inorganic carbon transporter subunit DabA n=1 Tax=Lentiprolixibacter aurantiacus TaxID=2993939 RepID=A0AAE3SM16_9FLAO|nr:DUF2309 domain-containing protein [Lentiprolixibacter aurantiacus]MCX2718094.1 DUF2309 domain-containing protein [Lentiprolixibacter aurantiacus]